MKDLIMMAFTLIVAVTAVLGLLALCGLAVSMLLNVVLGQMGLGLINFWGGCCIVASVQLIKAFISW